MLLVEPPDAEALSGVISALLDGRISREAVLTWQRAVFADCGWEVPISKSDGFWYFYSLGFVTTLFPDGYFLRKADLEEYLLDLNKSRHLRNPGGYGRALPS